MGCHRLRFGCGYERYGSGWLEATKVGEGHLFVAVHEGNSCRSAHDQCCEGFPCCATGFLDWRVGPVF